MTPNASVEKTHQTLLQRIDGKTPSLSMLFGVMSFSFFAGMMMDTGITEYLKAKTLYHWIGDFAIGLGILVVAFRWAVPLLARVRQNHGS